MTRLRLSVTSLLLPLLCTAQEKPVPGPNPALEWAVAVRGRFAQMSDPVVAVHGTASLARVVCPYDSTAAAGLFRDAIAGLAVLPDSAFLQRGTTALPAASFTGLWKYVAPAAVKCDPSFADALDSPRSRERMDAERRNANATLARGFGLIDPTAPLDKKTQLDRAAQMGAAALDAGDPETLSLATLTGLAARLRERAPDLADELFQRALDFVLAAPLPSPDNLQILGRYLFTAPIYLDQPDEDLIGLERQAGGLTVQDFMATRHSANPDAIQSYIESLARLLAMPSAVNRNPVVAWALAYQCFSRARDLLPARVPDLEKAIAELQAANSGAVGALAAQLGALESADPESGDPATKDYRLIGRIQSALAGKRIDEARGMLPQFNDGSTRSQVRALIDFAEAALAIEAKSVQAVALADLLKSGVKRSLLYTGIIAGTAARDISLPILSLFMTDVKPLPAEQRVRLHSAAAAALIRSDGESAYGTLKRVVEGYNDIYVSPRRGKFDPASARRRYTAGLDSSSDTALILGGSRGFYEAVDTVKGRRNFPLRVAGAGAFGVVEFLASAATLDPSRLEAALLGLHSETLRAAALVQLAAVRLKAAGATH